MFNPNAVPTPATTPTSEIEVHSTTEITAYVKGQVVTPADISAITTRASATAEIENIIIAYVDVNSQKVTIRLRDKYTIPVKIEESAPIARGQGQFGGIALCNAKSGEATLREYTGENK